MSDYAELRKLAEAATPGPWMLDPDDHYAVVENRDDWAAFICGNAGSDSRYIAAADPQTVLGLMERLERYEVALEGIRDMYPPGPIGVNTLAAYAKSAHMTAERALEPPA